MKKTIIIGATSGIGKALTKILLDNNYNVGIMGRKMDVLEKFKKHTSQNIEIKYLDCTIDNNAEKITELTETLGGLDLLIFSAGIGNLNRNLGFKVENEANKLNVLAFTEIADWSFRFFEKQGYGHFVSITSLAGLFGYRKAPAYHAAKAYQINYLEGLRQKAYKSGKSIFITDVRPGFVDTAMSKGKKQFWVISKENAAKQIFSIIQKRKDVGYCPKRWWLIAFIIKLLPNWVRKRI